MAKISLICEHCGGNIILDDSHEIGTCESCFSQFVIKQDKIVQKITQNITKYVYGYEGKDVEELLTEGFNMLNQGNQSQANSKFKHAIDIEPNCWNAWLGYATSLPDNYSNLITKVNAYTSAYNLADSEHEETDTFVDMTRYIPDNYLRSAFVRAFNLASPNERGRIFEYVSRVIGCDETEIAHLAVDISPSDWRSYFSLAKIRQIRARWSKKEGFINKKLPDAALEVEDIFLKAYDIAKNENDIQGMKTIKNHLENLLSDNSYHEFAKDVFMHMQ